MDENTSRKASNSETVKNHSEFTEMRRVRKKDLEQTTIDMETVSAGSFPRYDFRLRVTSRDCKQCSLCWWFESCIGCLIPDDNHPATIKDGDSISLD